MQVTYQATADDYRHALLAYRNRNFFSRWSILFVVFFFSIWAALQAYLMHATDQSWLNWSLPWTLVSIGLLLFAQWGSPYFNARRQFRNTPSAQGLITLKVQDEGLHFHSPNTDASVSWEHYIKWIENGSIFVLFSSPLIFVIIPKRAFDADQLPRFKDILRKKIPV